MHDISELLKTLKVNGISYPESFSDSVVLKDYAVVTRYPVISEPVSEEEYREAVAMAGLVYDWSETEINRQYKLGL